LLLMRVTPKIVAKAPTVAATETCDASHPGSISADLASELADILADALVADIRGPPSSRKLVTEAALRAVPRRDTPVAINR
jgi:hypothetical protein